MLLKICTKERLKVKQGHLRPFEVKFRLSSKSVNRQVKINVIFKKELKKTGLSLKNHKIDKILLEDYFFI